MSWNEIEKKKKKKTERQEDRLRKVEEGKKGRRVGERERMKGW